MAEAVPGTVCAWLRNDLRAHDNRVLHEAAMLASASNRPFLPVYVFDPRYFQRTRYGTLRTGAVRGLFLLQSVLALKRRLRRAGSDLLVKVGRPEKVLPPLLASDGHLLTQQEVTSAELSIDGKVRRALDDRRCRWKYCWGSTLFHKDDIGCGSSLDNVPEYFNQFVKVVWSRLTESSGTKNSSHEVDVPTVAGLVRPCLPDADVNKLSLPEDLPDLDFEPTWQARANRGDIRRLLRREPFTCSRKDAQLAVMTGKMDRNPGRIAVEGRNKELPPRRTRPQCVKERQRARWHLPPRGKHVGYMPQAPVLGTGQGKLGALDDGASNASAPRRRPEKGFLQPGFGGLPDFDDQPRFFGGSGFASFS